MPLCISVPAIQMKVIFLKLCPRVTFLSHPARCSTVCFYSWYNKNLAPSPETNLQPTRLCLMLHWLLTKLWTINRSCLPCLSFSPSDWHVLVAPLPVAVNPESALPEPSLYFAAWMLCELQNISLPGVRSVQFHELQILHKPECLPEEKHLPSQRWSLQLIFLPYFDVRPSCFFPSFINFQF